MRKGQKHEANGTRVRTNSCYASIASFYWCVCGQMAVSMAITGRNRAHIVQTYRPEEEQRRWSISGDADAALWRVMMAKTCRRCHFAARTDERFHRGTDRPATSEERGKCEPVTSSLIEQRSSPAVSVDDRPIGLKRCRSFGRLS